MEEETISIPKSRYIYLLRLERYVEDWCPRYIKCTKCGHYHPEGCVCLNCEE